MRRALAALAQVLVLAGSARAQDAPQVTPAPAPAQAPQPAPAAPAGSAPNGWTEPPPPTDPNAPGGPAERPLEPPPPPSGPPPPPPIVVAEPPLPPGFVPVFEPPPPPEPRHIAPRTSLWLGARVGWFVPFGNAWAAAVANGPYLNLKGVPWRDYASPGPMFELDAGARLSRSYNLFLLWERAELGSGRALNDVNGGQTGGDTDFWAVGVRATSNADGIGFVTELAVGYRRARSRWRDGTEYQFTNAPFEGRISAGAEIRVNPLLSLSPLLSLGVGSFGTIRRVSGDVRSDPTGPLDQADGHAWFTLTFGGHFDLAGRP